MEVGRQRQVLEINGSGREEEGGKDSERGRDELIIWGKIPVSAERSGDDEAFVTFFSLLALQGSQAAH